ncbi:MAG: DUF1801 domain-containing protein [Bacteroidales bacterium]|nr:DUF1801 domain-containing protein [Bacteroidales bacterium]MCF8458561.1 DUF1801 domain-containing protein [Bacteroidales bacterium]
MEKQEYGEICLVNMKKSIAVEEYILNNEKWQEVLIRLREIFLTTEVEESIKWGQPAYSVNGKNIAGLGAFKSYVAIWFHQGTLLSDPHKLLINAQEGVTKALRQMRFSSVDQIDENIVNEYIREAIQNQKEGKSIKPDTNKELILPDELAFAFQEDPEIEAAFKKFTLGKQREFAGYILEVKKHETKQKRLQKIVPLILDGVGLNDRYK